MKHLKWAALAALGLTTTGCAGELGDEDAEPATQSSDAIINGEREVGYRAVALIRWTKVRANGAQSSSVCTGTLVSRRTVLTAAHCVVSKDPTVTYGDYRVFFGSDASDDDARYLPASLRAAHPGYDPKAFGKNDYGVLLLDRDAPVRPMKIASRIGDLRGVTVTHVGFGATQSVDRNTKSGFGTKKYAVELPITQQTDTLLRTGDGKSGICNGDSGGPAIVEVGGDDVVVGVHSYVDDADRCLKNGYSSRTDRAMAFLAPFL